jgi:hypothetical protein
MAQGTRRASASARTPSLTAARAAFDCGDRGDRGDWVAAFDAYGAPESAGALNAPAHQRYLEANDAPAGALRLEVGDRREISRCRPSSPPARCRTTTRCPRPRAGCSRG